MEKNVIDTIKQYEEEKGKNHYYKKEFPILMGLNITFIMNKSMKVLRSSRLWD